MSNIDNSLSERSSVIVEQKDQQQVQPINRSIQPQPKERYGHKPSIVYRSQVDGLRSVAILPVIAFHYQILKDFTSGGFGGVDVFFVISGFLVSSIIISELLKSKFSLLVFYERRIRRLFPAIFVTLTIIVITGYYLYFQKDKYQQLLKQETAAIGYVANIYFYYKKNQMGDEGYFDDSTQSWPFLHFWSLAVQQQFYMVTPLFLMLLIKITKKAKFLKFMFLYSIVTILISLALSIWLTQSDQMFAFYLLPCRAWELGLGGLVAVLLHSESMNKLRRIFGRCRIFLVERNVTIILQIISWLGLTMILASYAIFNKVDDHFPGYKALLPCCGASIYIASNFIRYRENQSVDPLSSKDFQISAKSEEPANQRIMLTSARFLSLSPIVWVGQISYALYLWHWPIWVFFNYFMHKELTLANKIFCIVLTFVLAYLSTNKIQNPIRNKKKVTTSILWKGFGVLWILSISFLLYGIYTNIGGWEEEVMISDKQSFDPSGNSSSSLFPKYDPQGYLLTNPYRSLQIEQISLQKMGWPTYSSQDYRIPFRQIRRQSPDIKPILVNYSQQDMKQNKRICLLTLGSSHSQHHAQTLIQLANKYNVSFGSLAGAGTRMNFYGFNNKTWDDWRIDNLKKLRPHMIFAQNYWTQWEDQNYLQMLKKSIDPLLELPVPPQYIGLFGDNPQLTLEKNEAKLMTIFLKQLYGQNGNSWDFMETLGQKILKGQPQIQDKLHQYILANYDPQIVKFYPHLYQFLQDSQTGNIQVIGSQIDGRLLYRDHHHITLYGSRRYKNYFEQKVFLKAKELCNQ